MSDAIDLTLSDDEVEVVLVRSAKRHMGHGSGGQLPAPQLKALALEAQVVLDDEDVVEVVEQQQESPPIADVALGEGEELAIVGQSGQVWNSDLPHPREFCGRHPFQTKAVVSNRVYCPQCYCYVCDEPASACRRWGTGRSSSDQHCNAHVGDTRYRSMRQARKAKKRPRAEEDSAGDGAAA